MFMILTIIGSALIIMWGTAHLFPTKNVVKGFGNISEDNKNIVRMEWINEGVTLIFLGVLLIVSIIVTGKLVPYMNILVIIALSVLSIISLLTGFRIKFLPFKLCPIIFSLSSLFIGLGIIF